MKRRAAPRMLREVYHAQRASVPLAQRLLEAGADPTIRGADGRTALEIARDSVAGEDEEIAATVKVLESAMREVKEKAEEKSTE